LMLFLRLVVLMNGEDATMIFLSNAYKLQLDIVTKLTQSGYFQLEIQLKLPSTYEYVF
jgi:hypothetical protein